MKNVISKICLMCLSALLLFCFCSCSKDNPDGEDKPENEASWEEIAGRNYSAVDEFSDMLVENKSLWQGDGQALNLLHNNESVSAFFNKDSLTVRLAQNLYDAKINREHIYSLYKICSKETWWYNNIVVKDSSREAGSTPFGEVDRTYYPLFLYNFKPEKLQVQEGVKKLFKNPDSVSITSEINFYYDADGAKEAYGNVGKDIKMLVSFTARAKDNYGYTVGNFSAEYGYPNEFSDLQQNGAINDSIWRFSGTYTKYD